MEFIRGLAYVPAEVTTLVQVFITAASLWLLYVLLRNDPEKAVDFTVAAPEQCRPGWRGRVLDDPSIKIPGSTAIQCYAPATGQLLGLINPSTPDGIERIITRASAAQTGWAKTTFAQRRQLLKTLLKFVLDNQDDIVRASCLDSGKTRVDALFGEVLVTVEKLLMFYKRNEVHYEPLGIVAACVSWNYPFHNLMGPVISSLFAGNAVIVKNSEQTAWSSEYYCRIVRAALRACSHDPNLVQNVTCWPQTAAYLTAHPEIGHLTFIGSRPVAHEVAKSAASALTPLCIELGGKDAAIVLDDPESHEYSEKEMKRITSIIMRGVFQSAGQNCIGIERVIAMPQAYNKLISMLEPRIKALRVGSDLDSMNSVDFAGGVDVGAMISPAPFDRLEKLIDEAVAQGAKLLAGGRRYQHPTHSKGHYFEPTLLVDVEPTMRIAQEEVFAPICVLMSASSVTSVISMANSTKYGLGCSIFGPTASSAARTQLKHVTESMKTGNVAINDFAVFYAVQLPFGGVRGSGYGRFAGEEGLRSLCNIKSVCKDNWNGLIKTTIPQKLDYPMQHGALEMGKGVIAVGYGESVKRKLQGIKKMIGA